LVLWHVGLDADHVAVHHREHRNAAGGVGLHQATIIDIALGDDAIERRHHALIRLELQQYLKLGLLGTDVCLRDSDRGLLRPQVQPFCVCLLTRDPALACQIAVAVPGDARDLPLRFRLVERRLADGERRLGLGDLAIKLWGGNLGEKLVRLNVIPDVDVPETSSCWSSA
jgi:hypothetical protein